jgi:soluble lytic murein transglycosylase-like protein
LAEKEPDLRSRKFTLPERKRFCWLLAAVLWLLPVATEATIYRYVDDNGVIHFTNIPIDSRYQPLRPNRSPKLTGVESSAARFESYIKVAARRFDVDPLLITAVIQTESSFNCQAISQKGAQGLMQLMPETARELQVGDPFDPEDNIRGGTMYLRKMLDLFDGDLQLALAAYNAGPTRVKALGRVPRIPETIQYIERVMLNYRQYQAASPYNNLITVAYD